MPRRQVRRARENRTKQTGGSPKPLDLKPRRLKIRLRSDKRCFLNGVCQNVVFRGWSGSARAECAQMLENTGVFRHSLSLCIGFPLLQAGVRNLKNTVWKTPFGNLRSDFPARNAVYMVRCGTALERALQSDFASGNSLQNPIFGRRLFKMSPHRQADERRQAIEELRWMSRQQGGQARQAGKRADLVCFRSHKQSARPLKST